MARIKLLIAIIIAFTMLSVAVVPTAPLSTNQVAYAQAQTTPAVAPTPVPLSDQEKQTLLQLLMRGLGISGQPGSLPAPPAVPGASPSPMAGPVDIAESNSLGIRVLRDSSGRFCSDKAVNQSVDVAFNLQEEVEGSLDGLVTIWTFSNGQNTRLGDGSPQATVKLPKGRSWAQLQTGSTFCVDPRGLSARKPGNPTATPTPTQQTTPTATPAPAITTTPTPQASGQGRLVTAQYCWINNQQKSIRYDGSTYVNIEDPTLSELKANGGTCKVVFSRRSTVRYESVLGAITDETGKPLENGNGKEATLTEFNVVYPPSGSSGFALTLLTW